MTRRLRHRRCLRRIADLEEELGIWPPWHLVRERLYTEMNGSPIYRRPTAREIGPLVAEREEAA